MEKSKESKIVPNFFLTLYNNQNGTSYHLERAENAFPELIGQKRWEFVARQDKTCPEWKAIEVKGLVTPDIGSKRAFWKDFFSEVTKDINYRIKGTFEVRSPPRLNLKRRKRDKR